MLAVVAGVAAGGFFGVALSSEGDASAGGPTTAFAVCGLLTAALVWVCTWAGARAAAAGDGGPDEPIDLEPLEPR